MWALDTERVHLNHGSFGAAPVEVLEAQTRIRNAMEAAPTRFMLEDLPHLLTHSRKVTSDFVNADAEGLVFVANASAGVAAVLRSMEPYLTPGDEVLTHSHDYNAVRQMLVYLAQRLGLTVKVALIPYPITSSSDAAEAILSQVSGRTKLVILDHITSPTGLILPVERIARGLEPEVPVLLDGAHGPGQVPIDLLALGVSWYTGNLHKWVCAPKGAGFLHTRQDRREMTIPTVISHGWNADVPEGSSRYRELFDWTGTDDFTPWLVVPNAIAAVENQVPGGWPSVMRSNHEMVVAGRDVLAGALDAEPTAPEEMIGAMASLRLSNGTGPAPAGDLSPMTFDLIEQGFETLVSAWPSWPQQLLRVSAFLYNNLDDYEALAAALVRRPAAT